LIGAVIGLYFGGLGLLIVWALGGDVGFAIGLFGVLPLAVVGGAFLGKRLFLSFGAFANRLRLPHPRLGAVAWVSGSVVVAVLAALAAILAYALVHVFF
jgi:hypothetical protein